MRIRAISRLCNGKILGQLYNYDWPGNVRELQNVLQRFITLKTLDFMTSAVAEADIPTAAAAPVDEAPSFDSLRGRGRSI